MLIHIIVLSLKKKLKEREPLHLDNTLKRAPRQLREHLRERLREQLKQHLRG